MSFKTTAAGIATILAGIATYIVAFINGHGTDPLAWGLLITAITNGIGLLKAEDAKP